MVRVPGMSGQHLHPVDSVDSVGSCPVSVLHRAAAARKLLTTVITIHPPVSSQRSISGLCRAEAVTRCSLAQRDTVSADIVQKPVLMWLVRRVSMWSGCQWWIVSTTLKSCISL